MYNFNFKGKISVITWEDVYWGISEDILNKSSAVDYAESYLEVNSDDSNPYIIDLLISEGLNKEETLSAILKIIGASSLPEKDKDMSFRRLRYFILKDIKNKTKNTRTLLTRIDGVYADFDYPTDMKGLIYYMPPEDDDWYNEAERTQKECEQHLVDKFRSFMDKEEDELVTILQAKI